MSSDAPAPRSGVSPTVLVLAILLAIAATAAVVLALRPSAPTVATQTDPVTGKTIAVPVTTPSTEPFVQKDTVSPKGKASGQVWYPIPFGSPPNLKLGTSKREYLILTETEYGFTWAARAAADD